MDGLKKTNNFYNTKETIDRSSSASDLGELAPNTICDLFDFNFVILEIIFFSFPKVPLLTFVFFLIC